MLSNELKPHTKADLVNLQQLLTTTKTLQSAKEQLPVSLANFIESQMHKTNSNFETVVKDIKTDLASMKYIKLYISFEPSKRLEDQILASFDIPNTDRYIEVLRDESIIGGAKIVIDGKLYDETVDKQIYEKCI